MSYFFVLFCAGCVLEPQEPKMPLGVKLETEKDLISAIEAYNNVYKGCKCPWDMIRGTCEAREYTFKWDTCDESLRNPDIKYNCLEFDIGDNSTMEYTDTSDECVLYRRKTSYSSIEFFDFARFIPEDTKIKTDERFKQLAEFYEKGINTCDTLDEITTTERAQCKDEVKDLTRQLAQNKKPKCNQMNVFKEEYRSFIARIKYMTLSNQPSASMKELITYTQSHLCDASDYINDAGFTIKK